MTEVLYSTDEAARKLGCSPSYLRKLEGLGLIRSPARVVGSNHRIWPDGELPTIQAQIAARQSAGRPNRSKSSA